MFTTLLTLALVIVADPQTWATTPPKVQMPRVMEAPAPLKPLSALTPATRPVVRPAPAYSESNPEPGLEADFLSPDMWLLAVRSLKLFRPVPPPAVEQQAEPEVIFRRGNTDDQGRDHQWRHLEDVGWKSADRPLVEQKITQDVARKWKSGLLQPREKIVVKGEPIEYRPFEFEQGKINIGTAYPGQVPPSLGNTGFTPWRGLGWLAPLTIPASSSLRNPLEMSGSPFSSTWDQPSLLSRPAAAPKYGLGVDTDLMKHFSSSPLFSPIVPKPALWQPPTSLPPFEEDGGCTSVGPGGEMKELYREPGWNGKMVK